MIAFLFCGLFLFSCPWVNAQSLEEREWLVAANDLYAQKKYKEARALYEKALDKTPANLKANYNLGNVYYQEKKYKEAQNFYTKSLKSAKTSQEKAKIYHNLGNSQMQSQKYKEAVESYKNALRNHPSDNSTRSNLILAKKLLKQQEEKKKNNPPDLPKPSDYAKQMKQKSDSLMNLGQFTDAQKLMRKAAQKDSTVLHFKTYIEKLNEIVILDTLQLK